MVREYFPAIILFIGYICVSIGMTLLGPIIPHIVSQYNLSYSDMGFIAGITYIGGSISFIGGFIISITGYFWLTILSLILMSLGLIMFPLTIPTIFMYLSYFLIGLGSGFFETAVNPLIAEIYSERKGMFLNIIHVGWNVGAFIGPSMIGIVLMENISWKYIYSISSILLLLETLLLLSLKKHVSRKSGMETIFDKNIFHSREIILFIPIAIGMFLYLGCEQAVNIWLPTLIKNRGGSETISSISIAVFWITIGIGRIIWSPIIDSFGYYKSLRITTLGILIFSFLGIFQKDPIISLI
ncbi:MAG TPA: MFS transporter, partial [Thermoprotei archaeon]|nr:MFS transporter [Thermoprotei archaeon]